MALNLGDLLGRRLDPLGVLFNQSLTTVATIPIFTVPAPGRIGCVAALVFTQPVGITGSCTASFGSGATATDFVASAALTLPGLDTVIVPPATSQVAGNTWIAYASGTVFNFKITVAATTGTMSIYALGWLEP
jgi:hypothetical protein